MKRLLISIHDIAPPFERDISDQLDQLQQIGISTLSLKVVPKWHGEHPLSRSPSLLRILQPWVDRGCKVILHGFEHRPRGALRGSPARIVRAKLFAGGAAEFMTLSGPDAMRSIDAGLQELRACSLPEVDTFCPPGWLITDECEDAVSECGLRRLILMNTLIDLRQRRSVLTPSAGFMGAGPVHEAEIGALNRLSIATGRKRGLIKIYLHPDPSGRRRWQPWIATVRDLLSEGWQPVPFDMLDGDEDR